MITVYIPNNHIQERSYIIRVLFGEFLGLKYKVSVAEGNDYRIVLENGRELIIKDAFFSLFKDDFLEYLAIKNVPSNVIFVKNQFAPEKDIPILYGNEELSVNSEQIICGIDLFASSFFMLTRWEEYVNKERDMHNRFPATASVAYKFGFLDRPIVNEYVEMIWNMLRYLGIEQERKKRNFKLILTHDVDHICYWKNFKQLIRVIGGDLVNRRSFSLALTNLYEYISVKSGFRQDPYDTFDWLMDLSEQVNVKSHFYFMSGGITDYDNRYEIESLRAQSILKRIQQRGHIIGFHPSYNSYNNPIQWKQEKLNLEEVAGIEIKEGRQHYLRFEIPTTWGIWSSNGMEMDCTLGYADKAGFRCGTCYEFSVFDILERKRHKLKEYPLITMEGTLVQYEKLSLNKVEESIEKFVSIVKKYRGNFVFLWHNSSFVFNDWKPYKNIYERVIKNVINSK